MSDLLAALKSMTEAEKDILRQAVARPVHGVKTIDYGEKQMFYRENKDGSKTEVMFNVKQPGFDLKVLANAGWKPKPGPKPKVEA